MDCKEERERRDVNVFLAVARQEASSREGIV